ncbi:hypothetical protein [uncultured Metabacillus sp.]|uniref:hypothetical protein n=1 Tax=uncultured Metabacillus sp. TaxID=2860135 RepID=UPI002606A21D|nr:hypothetical protein [uncultured Metabacillus sp.]
MEKETIKLTSNFNIILSEDENSDTADVKFIICDFNPNANGVSLNREKIENWLSTLNIKPVVGKVVTRFDGKRDFSGHNAKIVEETDDQGNKVKSVEFDTSAFGSFYETSIETIDDVEYITAKAKVWKRFSEAYKVFKKRSSSKKGLKTSWEINVIESHEETIDGKTVKVVDDGVFIGHALLGEFVPPAYKASGVLEVASSIPDDEFTSALSQDMISLSENTEVNNATISNEGGREMEKENQKELSALTDNDLYKKVRKAINSANEDKWYYISMLQPYEYRAIAYTWDRESEEDYVEFVYTVNSDDTISVTSQKDVKMVFVPKEQIETQVSELEIKLTETEKEIADAGKAVSELTKEKEDLETQVAELTQYKEKVEEMELAEKERELASKKEELKTFALEDELIQASELEEDETLSTIFSELTLENYESSQEKIEVIKGRKAIAKFKENKTSQKEETDVEVSEVKAQSKAKTDLNNGDSDGVLSAMDVMKSFLGKGK